MVPALPSVKKPAMRGATNTLTGTGASSASPCRACCRAPARLPAACGDVAPRPTPGAIDNRGVLELA
jgi:hypothetical protein